MSDEARVQDLLAPMREHRPDLNAPQYAVDRGKVLDRMSTAAERAAASGLRRAPYLALALAASVALAVGLGSYLVSEPTAPVTVLEQPIRVLAIQGEVAHEHGDTKAKLGAREASILPAQGELVTMSGAKAEIKTHSGVRIGLGENTRLPLADLRGLGATDQVRLSAGSIRCQIPHLTAGHSFQVVTPDARVVVHGTTFGVAVTPGGGNTQTSVSVEEGVVVVHHPAGETRLTAEQSWRSEPTRPAGVSVTELEKDEAVPSKPRPGGSTVPSPQSEEEQPAGTLAKETRLLKAALTAERNGELRAAQASFERLLRTYPDSPLAPDARLGLSRVKTRLGQQ